MFNKLQSGGVHDRLIKSAIFGMVALGVCGAVAGSLAGPRAVEETGSVVAARDLRFADRSDGAVVITDTGLNQVVDVLHGEQGFIRATLRGLARTRKSEGVGAEPSFRLTAWSDGRLTLDDSSTGRHVELQAFGSTNVASFARLLPLAPRTDQAAGHGADQPS